MPAKSFLRRVTGRTLEIIATVVSTGIANAGDVVGLDDTGHLDPSVMPAGFGSDTKVAPASEALSARDLVNVWNNAGVEAVRKADASAEGKPADGYVLDAVSSGTAATVYFGRKITGLSGIEPGKRYYLATTPGGFTAIPVSGAGRVDQYIGKGISPTEVAFEPDDYVVKAA